MPRARRDFLQTVHATLFAHVIYASHTLQWYVVTAVIAACSIPLQCKIDYRYERQPCDRPADATVHMGDYDVNAASAAVSLRIRRSNRYCIRALTLV